VIDKDSDEFKKGEMAFDLIKRRYDSEITRISDLDGKAGTQIGFISIVLSLLIGVGTFDFLDKLTVPKFFLPYFIGIGLLLLSFVFSLLSVKVREWTFAPDTDKLFNEGFNPPFHAWNIMLRTSKAMNDAVIDIETKNNKKAKNIARSWYFLIGGLAGIIIYVIVVLFSGTDTDATTIMNVQNMTVGNMTVQWLPLDVSR